MPQPPWSPGPAQLRPGALAASLIPPELLPPSSSLPPPVPPPSLLLLLLTPSFSQRNPAPCLLLPSPLHLPGEHAQGTTGVVVLRTWCYRGNNEALGLTGTTKKMAEGVPN